MHEIKPVDVHKEPLYWGKPLPLLLDFEILQVYENLLEIDQQREEARVKLQKRNIKLPEINNPNHQSLKEAILNELNRRNIKP